MVRRPHVPPSPPEGRRRSFPGVRHPGERTPGKVPIAVDGARVATRCERLGRPTISASSFGESSCTPVARISTSSCRPCGVSRQFLHAAPAPPPLWRQASAMLIDGRSEACTKQPQRCRSPSRTNTPQPRRRGFSGSLFELFFPFPPPLPPGKRGQGSQGKIAPPPSRFRSEGTRGASDACRRRADLLLRRETQRARSRLDGEGRESAQAQAGVGGGDPRLRPPPFRPGRCSRRGPAAAPRAWAGSPSSSRSRP